jgi:hypothetical protein
VRMKLWNDSDPGHLVAIQNLQKRLTTQVKLWDQYCSNDPGGPTETVRNLRTVTWQETPPDGYMAMLPNNGKHLIGPVSPSSIPGAATAAGGGLVGAIIFALGELIGNPFAAAATS